jgi:5-hydroxyisourate hydrolase-like protein (transthyretin family)
MMQAVVGPCRAGALALRLLTLSAIAVAAIVTLTVGSASASYSVVECVPGNGWGAPDAQMIRPFAANTFKIAQANDCGGWGLRNEANGQSNNGTWVAWQFSAAPGTRFESAQSTVHYYATGGYGTMTSGNGTPGYSSVGTGAPPDHWVTPVQNNTNFYSISEQCFASPCSSTAAYSYITNFYASIQDQSPPSISASGDALNGGVVSGVQTINATVNDYGGGIRSIEVTVNGIPSAGTGDMCVPDRNGSYSSLKPCPDSSGSRAIQLDTEHGAGWVNGANDVQVCGYDVGGNQSPCIYRTVQVDNSCAASGGSPATSIDSGADVGGQLRQRAQLTSNDAPVIRGTVTSSGSPVAGATVCLYQTIDLPDAGRELVTQVTTQANGRFATRLDPGASRTIYLVYRYNTQKLTNQVELDSTVVPTLRLPKKRLLNGQPAFFLGQLPGPDADGRAVALQARTGRKWRTFKQLRTDANGKFMGKYRFTHTVGRQRYLFRALVKSQSGYPYEPGASAKRKLIVHG